jgi:hypothetical protein
MMDISKTRIPASAMAEVREAVKGYCNAVMSSELPPIRSLCTLII